MAKKPVLTRNTMNCQKKVAKMAKKDLKWPKKESDWQKKPVFTRMTTNC